jgi:hypothetical protein
MKKRRDLKSTPFLTFEECLDTIYGGAWEEGKTIETMID